MKRLEPYMSRQDERGSFLGITNEAWHEVNRIETVAGQVRGNHYHRHTRELFFILSGEIEIRVEHIESGEKTEFTAKAGDIFVIEPLELHTFRTLTDTVWLNLLDHPMDPNHMDFHRLDMDPEIA